jgi:guanylate kinase
LSKGRLIVFASPAGGGKTTVIQKLRERHPEWTFSVSATTRKPRQGEVQGREYHFLTREDFLNRVSAGEFLEHEDVHGEMYGTLVTPTRERLARGETVIFDLDVLGALNVKKSFPAALTIFLMPPSREVLHDRLMKRHTESAELIEKRLSRTDMELAVAPQFDVQVVNDDLERAVNEVDEAIQREQEKQGSK